MSEVGWGFEQAMWQPHNGEQRSVSRPVSQAWGSASWLRATHDGLKHPGRGAWKQHAPKNTSTREELELEQCARGWCILFITVPGLCLLCVKRSHRVDVSVFATRHLSTMRVNANVCDWNVIGQSLGGGFWRLDMRSQNGWPTLELALPHTEKEREEGKKGPLMKELNPAPHSHSFAPSSSLLPCGVNLAKRRQQQPIYTSTGSFFFLCCAFPFARLAGLSTAPHSIHLSVLCLYVCLPIFVCAPSAALCMHQAVE